MKGKDNLAFSAIVHTCDPILFAHEIGHNMGLGHDSNEGKKGIFANSWGNHFTGTDGKGYHTIMAYGKSGFTIRTGVWSGPNVDYKGTKTGSSAADAVDTIKQTNIPIIKYR